MSNLLWTIVTILFVLWIAGLLLRIGGSFIHMVLVVAVIIMIYNLLTQGRATL